MTQWIEEPTLVGRLRGGQDDAFGELFEEHAPAVRRLAMSLASDRSEAEDITAETFFRVLRAIKRGNGPNDNVRGYLLTVARRVAWEWHGAANDVPVTDDELTNRAGSTEAAGSRTAEYSLITRAFSSLPERWRTVLWQTEVEGAQPAVVAPKFGLSPNATAALARRARLGLRAAYLQAHLATHNSELCCRPVLDKLGGYTAGSVTGAEARKISEHLGTCAQCRATHDELRDVCYSLRAHSGGIAVMVPATAGAAFGAGTGAGGGVGSSAALGAGSSTGGSTSGGFMTTLKGVVTSTKLKVGLAVASTAAAGIFGASAGPALSDAVEVLGLAGLRGLPTSGGAHTAGEFSDSGETLQRSDAPAVDGPVQERRGAVWGLDDKRAKAAKDRAADPADGDPSAPDAKDQREVKPGLPDAAGNDRDVPVDLDQVTGSLKNPVGSRPDKEPADTTSSERSDEGAEDNPAPRPKSEPVDRSEPLDEEPPAGKPSEPAPEPTEPATEPIEPATEQPADQSTTDPTGDDVQIADTTSTGTPIEEEPTADTTAGGDTSGCTEYESWDSGYTEDGIYYEIYEYRLECN